MQVKLALRGSDQEKNIIKVSCCVVLLPIRSSRQLSCELENVCKRGLTFLGTCRRTWGLPTLPTTRRP